MQYNQVTEPQFLDVSKTRIVALVKFEHLPQAVNFSASADDCEAHGREIFERAISGEFGAIKPPEGYEFDTVGDIVPTHETASRLLSAAKSAALQKIEAVADEYQSRFLGANSPQRESRFSQNLSAAKRIVSGVGTPEDLQSMEMQAAAKAAETGETPKAATEFAAWIAAWEGKTTLIAGAIEAFLVQSRIGLNALSDISHIEPFLADIAAQAEAKFAELAGS